MTRAQAITLETQLINAGIEHASSEVLGNVTVVAQKATGVPVDTIKTVADAVGVTAKATRVEFS